MATPTAKSKRRRKKFVREVSRREKVLGGGLLLLLPLIALAVYVRGVYPVGKLWGGYNPRLFALEAAALKGTSGSARVVPTSPVGSQPVGAEDRPTGQEVSFLSSLHVPQWKPAGEVERFTAANLYEKIDGRAEKYLEYDVVGLESLSFTDERDPNRFLDVYVFDLGEPANAFGIFSAERSPGLTPVKFGREGYTVQGSYFFWKGRYYVQILAAKDDPALEEAAQSLAQQVDAQLPPDDTFLWGLTCWPKGGLIPDSIQYAKRNALYQEFLTETYSAQYQRGEQKLTAFLSRQETPAAAERVWQKYAQFLESSGSRVTQRREQGVPLLVGEPGGAYDVVWQYDRWVGGVYCAPDPAAAEELALTLLTAVRTTGGAR
ncbi:MAG TPA: hypothetical protein EYP85_08935 [Armatimonadetes bacterium]|nr:hypothetical protein [Armatimonadota bacterium]